MYLFVFYLFIYIFKIFFFFFLEPSYLYLTFIEGVSNVKTMFDTFIIMGESPGQSSFPV